MSDTPWYDRNWVLWLAGTIVVIILALLQPFIDKNWPATVRGWLRLFGLPFGVVITIGVAGYVLGYSFGPFIVSVVGLAGFVIGYALGRRRRPYSGPLITVAGQPSVAPVVPTAQARLPNGSIDALTWRDLREDERVVVAILGAAHDGFLSDGELATLRNKEKWPIARWNAVVHVLKDQYGALEWAVRRTRGEGLELSVRGRRLAAEGYRALETSRSKEE